MARGIVESQGTRTGQPGSTGRRALASLFGIDTRALTVVRIGLALIILTEAVVDPPALTGGVAGTARLVVIPAALALLVGLGTRWATVITWLAYGLPLREALTQPGGTVHMGKYCLVLALFWCMFLPLGEHLSYDSRGERRRPVHFLSIASAGLLLQMFLIYFWAGVTKNVQEWVIDASALGTVLSHPDHGTALGQALTAIPAMLAVASVATVALEVFGAILLFAPLRGVETRRIFLSFIFIFFHAAMAVSMTLELFPYVMMVLWMVFLPPRVWNRLGDPVGPVETTVDRSRVRRALAATALAYVWVSSVVTWLYFPANEGIPGVIQGIGRNLMLYQQWAMFSLPSSL